MRIIANFEALNIDKTTMQNLEYILAHGSRNTFVTIDAVANKIETNSATEYVRAVCEHFKSDGLLFLEQIDVDGKEFYAMNMYNTDGTQAQMCGNGMRIVARLADERYINCESFTLYSGGRPYPIRRYEKIGGEIPVYGVEIAIRKASEDFTLSATEFVAQRIEELHPSLTFTYLNLGNPHIVAQVDEIDLKLLSQLGERVKELRDIFPYGVNVSFMQPLGKDQIFVATYERGVGLTPSCGTAMTASSTTAALLGICDWGAKIEVRNRGGFVHCICSKGNGTLTTQLIGNATYIEQGVINSDLTVTTTEIFKHETEAWETLTK